MMFIDLYHFLYLLFLDQSLEIFNSFPDVNPCTGTHPPLANLSMSAVPLFFIYHPRNRLSVGPIPLSTLTLATAHQIELIWPRLDFSRFQKSRPFFFSAPTLIYAYLPACTSLVLVFLAILF